MADKSAIEWTEATWNPVTGCSKVSPGCAHCYAETISLRFGRSKLPWTPENAAENVVLHPERLDQPLRWKRPRMIFVNSMSDLFHELVPASFIEQVWMTMMDAPQHTFQVLTKRPERALEVLRDCIYFRGEGHRYSHYDPLPNVWLGVSIESSRYTWRADVLRDVPAAVRFISAEPLLGGLYESERPFETGRHRDYWERKNPLDLTLIDWLIVGGESGPHARPMHPDWARELRDACESIDTAFFFKQWGGRTPKSGGRELDGREWNEMPR